MNEITARAFRNYRRENPRVPAVNALAIVKRQTTLPEWAAEFDWSMSGERWTGEVDGWDIVISTEVDQDTDISWLGEFTDDSTDAVPNPEYQHGRYKYFRPDADRVPTTKDYPAGMSRAEIREAIRAQMEADARLALEPQHVVSVTASRKGIELGSAVMGGSYIDGGNDLLWTVDDYDMISEAISEAETALAGLQNV